VTGGAPPIPAGSTTLCQVPARRTARRVGALRAWSRKRRAIYVIPADDALGRGMLLAIFIIGCTTTAARRVSAAAGALNPKDWARPGVPASGCLRSAHITGASPIIRAAGGSIRGSSC